MRTKSTAYSRDTTELFNEYKPNIDTGDRGIIIIDAIHRNGDLPADVMPNFCLQLTVSAASSPIMMI